MVFTFKTPGLCVYSLHSLVSHSLRMKILKRLVDLSQLVVITSQACESERNDEREN